MKFKDLLQAKLDKDQEKRSGKGKKGYADNQLNAKVKATGQAGGKRIDRGAARGK
jgi:hypothetical protein